MRLLLSLICVYVSLWTNGQSLSKQPARGDTLKDRDGNIYSVKTMVDNKLWMTENLKIKIPASYCYGDRQANCDRYGRLYTWESAQIGCKMAGEGWRLPSADEWRQMSKVYGGIFGDAKDSGKTAYKALMDGGNAAFDAVLGGGRSVDGTYRRGDAHGFYWTATETDSTNAWFSNFGKGSGKLFIQNNGEKSGAFAVRCVKDIEVE